jgi:hypothetical protein
LMKRYRGRVDVEVVDEAEKHRTSAARMR